MDGLRRTHHDGDRRNRRPGVSYDIHVSGHSLLTLHVLQGPDRGKRFDLPAEEPQLIGRSSESLPISDRSVSRRHAELTPDNGAWYLRDLESANGTFVNGNRITDRVKLEPGDQIRCGSTLMTFALTNMDERDNPLQMLDAGMFDVTVERRIPASGDSMILAAPDPMRAAIDHLRVIYDLTSLTAAVTDRDELLNRIMDLIFAELQPDRGFILLTSAPDAALDPAVVRYKVKPRTVDEGRIPVSRTIIQHTLERGEGILATNAMNDQRFRSGDSVRAYGIRSAICVPMRVGPRTFGVIHIDSSIANFSFTDEQLRLLSAIGQHTGLALQAVEVIGSRLQQERLAAMGQTVASLSHSIKNILQALRGGADAVELALNKGDLKMAREGWPILARNLDRIFALTQNMLAYAKPRDLEIELVQLRPLIEEVAQLMQPQADRKRVALLLDLADDMPPIPLDPNAVHQALMNLVTNAVEAAPTKTGLVTIRAKFNASDREAEISVLDNGPGIESARQSQIFEAFISTKGQRGTGLGLAVTRKIAEDHGGRLSLQSQHGHGACFVMTLPTERPGMDLGDTKLPR
jgi:signal transduction histidine kinase